MLYVYIYFFVIFVLPSLVNKALCAWMQLAGNGRQPPLAGQGKLLHAGPFELCYATASHDSVTDHFVSPSPIQGLIFKSICLMFMFNVLLCHGRVTGVISYHTLKHTNK